MRLQHWIGSSPAERGASATEYALLIAGVAVLMVGVIVFFGEALAGAWLGFGSVL